MSRALTLVESRQASLLNSMKLGITQCKVFRGLRRKGYHENPPPTCSHAVSNAWEKGETYKYCTVGVIGRAHSNLRSRLGEKHTAVCLLLLLHAGGNVRLSHASTNLT